jgi:hypothetical protein
VIDAAGWAEPFREGILVALPVLLIVYSEANAVLTADLVDGDSGVGFVQSGIR